MKRSWMALLLLCCFVLTGCTTRLELMMSHSARSDAACTEALEGFTAALESRDAEAIKALFSPKTRVSADLDTPIQALLDLTEGRSLRTEWNGLNSSGMSRHDGQVTEHATFRINLYIDDTPYFVWFELIYICDEDASAVGVSRIALKSDYLVCCESFQQPSEDGMYIDAYTGTDYQTRRLNGFPYIWTDVERTLTEAEMTAVILANPTITAVQEAFGQPNSVDIGYYYQLADENGEERYARLYANDDGSLQSADIISGTDWVRPLYDEEAEAESIP